MRTYLNSIACLTVMGILVTGIGCAHRRSQPVQALLVRSTLPAINGQVKSSNSAKQKSTIQTVAYQEEEFGASETNHSNQLKLGETAARLSFESDPVSLDQSAIRPIQEHHSALNLADLEAIALSNNPTIAAATANFNIAAGLRQQVGTRPNPTLGYSASQLADQATDQHTAFIQQEFVRGNKLALNQQVLTHTMRAQQWEIETQRQRVLTDVRMRFYEALAAQWQLDATNDFLAVAERGVEFAEQRSEAGEGTAIEVLQSKTLLSEINLALEQSTAAYRGAWSDLAAIAGIDGQQPTLLTAEFQTPDAMPDWDQSFIEIAAQSPELRTAREIVCEKQANLRRQQVQMIPNITGQIGAGYDRATDSGLINLQIGAPIPIRNKNCGNITAAHAEYNRAVEQVNRLERAIRSRLARAAQEYESALASVQKYEQEIIPQTRQTLELSEEGYRAGELDFLQVLVVRRSFYEASIKLITAQGHLAQANTKIDGLLLVGGLDVPQDFTSGDGLRGQSFGGQ